MTTDEQKYRAYTFNIAGFALMTPLGSIFLNPLTLLKEYSLMGRISYSLICLGLFFVGLKLIDIGRDILYRGR